MNEKEGAKLKGVFEIEVYDKDGNLISKDKTHNIITNEGLDAILDIMLHADTQVATWYVALYESNTAGAAGMTYAVPTYTECTAYDEATRQEYVEAASSSQSVTNSANKAAFTMNATKTLYGASLVSDNTKGNTAAAGAILFCAGLFTASQPVISGNVVNVTYSVSAADDGV